MGMFRGSTMGQHQEGWVNKKSAWARDARWSGVNIAAMVVAFVLFWPVGLVVLFWILSGRQVQELPGAVRELWSKMLGNDHKGLFAADNVIFNEYQQTQYDRIREIKEEIKSRAHRFAEFRGDIKRRADQEEFDRFMASSPQTENGRQGK